MGRLGGLLPFQSFPLRLRQPVINRHKLRGGERLAGLGQRQGLTGHPPGALHPQIGGGQNSGDARGGQCVIAELGAVPHHQLRGLGPCQLLNQVVQRDGPVRRQAAGALPIHLKPGVVDLMPAGIHGGADLAGEPSQVPGHGLQGGAAGAGALGGPGQPFGGGNPDAQPGKGPGARRHGDEVQVRRGEGAALKQVLHHGQQGLAVGQAAVLEGLGNEGFVLAQGGGDRHGGGFQS